jgi:signal transduction histidine kinase
MPPDVETTEIVPRRPVTRRVRSGFFWRLLVLVLISMLPALAIQAYSEIAGREAREAQVREDALRLARFASGEVDRIVENGHALLIALANLPAVRELDGLGCSTYVASLGDSFPQFASFGAFGPDGRPFCANIAIPPGNSAADRDFFQKAKATREMVVGDYVVGRLLNKPILPLALSFVDKSNRIAGVVFVTLDLDWLARYFAETRPFTARAALAITDRNGIVLARIPDNAKYVGKSFRPEYDAQLYAEKPGTVELTGIDGAERIIGYKPVNLPPEGIFVGVGIAKSDAFAAINDESRVGISLILIGLVTGLIFAWFGGRHFISGPIDRLGQAATEWGMGNYTARVGLRPGRSELMQLGHTFDTMAEELLRRQRENSSMLATLENRVAERTEVLERTNSELRSEMQRRELAEDMLRQAQKMEAIGELTGGVAHDFNNILQVILGNLGNIERRLQHGGELDIAALRRAVGAALSGGERAAVLTSQLLAFSRRQPLAPKAVDINRLIRGMSDLLHRTLGETIEVETIFGARLWQTFADANQLESAILNLAVNARDAMPLGGKLTIETANTFLDEDYAASEEDVRPGQFVLIAVSDTGAGMTAETIAKAFDPFFTTKDVGKGTGLGLSQVYGFIKQSGGHTKIYSEIGEGTSVKLYLPRLSGSDKPASDSMTDRAPLRGGTETILLVEDEVDVRNFAAEMLSELGYDVIEAKDGPAALALIEQRPDIRLLFTDVGLPGGLNGRQLADQAIALRPRLKVLYMTGYARNAIVHHGRLDEGVELLNKPFNSAALAARVRAVLDSGERV